MLTKLLSLERPLIVFDLETDGLTNCRIVEIGYMQFRPDGSIEEGETLVDPQRPIPPEVTAKNHITDAMVAGKPTWFQLAKRVAARFADCDFGGKNIRFDLGVLAEEMERVKVPWSYSGARILDADALERLGEPRDLTSLYKRRCGRDLDGAHRALADVRATVEVLEAQLALFDKLPRNLQLLHEQSWPGFVDAEGKIRMVDGVATITFGKHRGTAMRRVPNDYWKWIAGANFSAELKTIAAEAMAGRYPK